MISNVAVYKNHEKQFFSSVGSLYIMPATLLFDNVIMGILWVIDPIDVKNKKQ
jgi:hypothetical protein